jgi:hypothetical protein
MTRRLTHAVTALAAGAFPRAQRRDGRVVRDGAREAVDAGGIRLLAREGAALALAGIRVRARVAASDLRAAPWRDALRALAYPLAVALLLVWTFGFVPRYDHWPLGWGWTLLLGGSIVALAGAAFERRFLTAGGALAVLLAAVTPHFGYGTEAALSDTPSFFHGAGLDVAAAALLPTLLLVVAGLALPRRSDSAPRRGMILFLLGVLPSAIAAVLLLPAADPVPTKIGLVRVQGQNVETVMTTGPPYPFPWLPPSDTLFAILGTALAIAVIATWVRARSRPAPAMASALLLVSVSYPLAWLVLHQGALPYWTVQNEWLTLLLALAACVVSLLAVRRAAARRA